MQILIKKNEALSVRRFLDLGRASLQLALVAGESGLDTHAITDNAVNRPGLALTGYFKRFASKRVQYLGFCELSYLLDLDPVAQLHAIDGIDEVGIPCFVVTDRIPIPNAVVAHCNQRSLPLLSTHLTSAEFVERATIALDEYFAPNTVLSGTLVEVNGIGVLIQGLPALSKSVSTIVLIEHGHTLIADEVVCVSRSHDGLLIGSGKDLARGFMEFRGIGLLKVSEHFGAHAVRAKGPVDLIVRFLDVLPNAEKTGLEAPSEDTVLDCTLPLIQLPICSGNDACRLVEIAATLHLLRKRGHNPAEELAQRLLQQMETSA